VETASRKVLCQHRTLIARLSARGMSTSTAEPGIAFRCIIMGNKISLASLHGVAVARVVFSKINELILRLSIE
jgi:uncharacterized membrane protein (DUF441 family)